MFSEWYEEIRNSIFSTGDTPSRGNASGFVGLPSSDDPAIGQILWDEELGTGGRLDDLILETSHQMKQEVYGGAVYAVVPLYATSICMEECVYCNYRAGNKGIGVERIRLSDDELIEEARYLIEEKGLRTLELVYATDPLVRADSMCRHVELLERLLSQYGGGSVGINTEALEVEEYRSLVDAGLSFAVLWQETYDRERYGEVHLGKTKKTNFEYRLNAYERMIEGGIKNIGMGVLSGLAEWRPDWAMLIQHENYLRQEYGLGAAVLGIPRLKVAAGALLKESSFIPTRQEFLVTVALHNIYSPRTMAFVNTREDWELCVDLSKGGGCLFTFNCSTIPGGYSLGHRGYQFPTHSYDTATYVGRLQEQNLHAVFEWTLNEVESNSNEISRKASRHPNNAAMSLS
ncbi:MAG TPA: radical SAM protein [Pyrinomonadaceae bacterium]|nr:radical SAM protein [Pyrinomonadaceae bacterium]